MKSNTLWRKTLILSLVVASIMLISIVGLVGCGEPEDEPVDPGTPHTDIIAEDGTYEMTGMQAKVKMHPENFGDKLIVEKKDGIYYVTIEILNNTKVERLYWNGRKDSMTSDAVIVKKGQNTKYMYAFTDAQVQKKLDFHIGGGKMPLDPPFGFKIEFDKLTKVSDTVADVERPAPFLD